MVRLLDSKPDIDADAEDGAPLGQEKTFGHLELRNVHFRYRTSRYLTWDSTVSWCPITQLIDRVNGLL